MLGTLMHKSRLVAPRVLGTLMPGSRLLTPLLLGVLLFCLNDLALISGWLHPPAGYLFGGRIQAQDIDLYFSWAGGFRHQLLVPDYAAPWRTEPAFFNAPIWVIARVARLSGAHLAAVYVSAHLLFFIAAAYALFFAVRVFTETANQARAAWVVMLCSVPFSSLLVLPDFFLGRSARPQVHGLAKFVFDTSDGFLHGISSSALVTLGTACTLLTFALIGAYLKSGRRAYFQSACAAVFVSALAHASEPFAIVPAVSLALAITRRRRWPVAAREIGAFAASAGLGLLPYALLASRHAWLRDLAELSRRQALASPYQTLLALGVPTLLALLMLLIKPRLAAPTDLLLQCWVLTVLVGAHISLSPSPQHLLDGYHYGVSLLVVRQFTQISWPPRFPRLARVSLVLLLVLSAPAYLFYWRQSYQDGAAARPELLPTTLLPAEDLQALEWLRQAARSDDLVLAPPEKASRFITVPMHSFAGHWHWSLGYREQRDISGRFYAGKLGCDGARGLLNRYRVRYVLVPSGSAVAPCLKAAPMPARFGSLEIREAR
jgi:hypothetical protein